MDTPLPTEIADYSGILRDEEIKKSIEQNLLLTKETSDPNRIRQASYELRLSNEVEYLVLQDGEGRASAKYERPANGIDKALRIDPGQTVKAQVSEIFNLPNDIVAHIIPVGNVYKIGLSPETSFADPGFEGGFYVVLSNYSQRVVELNVGQPIARVEFVKLAKATKKPHPGSKHTSEPPIWPKRVSRPTKDELKAKGIDTLLRQIELHDPPHCEHAYITGELRSEITAKSSSSSVDAHTAQLKELKNQLRVVRVIVFVVVSISAAVTAFFLSPTLWALLPENTKTAIPEGISKGLGTFIGGLVAALLMFFYNRIANRKS